MPNIDLRKARAKGEKRFCPMLGEFCTKGWTPKMGMGADGFPVEGTCAAWQPIHVMEQGEAVAIHGCVQFDWKADLMISLDASMNRAGASVDKVATEVRRQHATMLGALTPEAAQRLIEAEPRVKELPEPGGN